MHELMACKKLLAAHVLQLSPGQGNSVAGSLAKLGHEIGALEIVDRLGCLAERCATADRLGRYSYKDTLCWVICYILSLFTHLYIFIRRYWFGPSPM